MTHTRSGYDRGRIKWPRRFLFVCRAACHAKKRVQLLLHHSRPRLIIRTTARAGARIEGGVHVCAGLINNPPRAASIRVRVFPTAYAFRSAVTSLGCCFRIFPHRDFHARASVVVDDGSSRNVQKKKKSV